MRICAMTVGQQTSSLLTLPHTDYFFPMLVFLQTRAAMVGLWIEIVSSPDVNPLCKTDLKVKNTSH